MGQIQKYARWADWEAAVLSKAKDPEKCQQIILARQREVDDNQDESDLIASILRQKLTQNRHSPDTCCVIMSVNKLAKWLSEETGEKRHLTKVTPYLKTLAIPELSRAPRQAKGAGWIWRGLKAAKTRKPIPLSKVYAPKVTAPGEKQS